MEDRLITLAIHTFDKAVTLKSLLEGEGIHTELNNVNLQTPGLSSGVRVRIYEKDLAMALRITENAELFSPTKTDERLILVPVDFSELSYKAVSVAAAIAYKRGAKLRLLYSYLDPYLSGTIQLKDTLDYDDGEPRAQAELKAEGERLMANFKERVRSAMKHGELQPVQMSTCVVEGVPEDVIINEGKEINPLMVVMGTRGANRKQAEMIGSITAEVLDEARFIVLTVPEPLTVEAVLQTHRVLFFSNLDQNDILAMDALYRLCGGDNVKVALMYAPQKQRIAGKGAELALERLCNYCNDNYRRYHFETVQVGEAAGEDIFQRLQQKEQFDMIVAPSRRRNAFRRLFNPGLTHRILNNNDVPILVIPV